LIFICPNLSSEFGFSNFVAIQFKDTTDCGNFSSRILTGLLYAYSEITGKCISVHGEHGKFRVVKITSEYLPYIMEDSLDSESKAYNRSQKVYRWDNMLKYWGSLKEYGRDFSKVHILTTIYKHHGL
jgi:hypothetical protein